MTQPNPYAFADDIDADIYADRAQQFDEQRQALMDQIIADLEDSAGSPIPPDERAKMLRLLEHLPTDALVNVDVVAASIQQNENVLEHFTTFMQVLETLNPHAPMLRAMFEMLNEMTNGEIERRWRVYQKEQLLHSLHYTLKGINNMSQQASADEAPEQIVSLINNLVQSLLDRIVKISDEYRLLAHEYSVDVDENLIMSGNYTPGRFPEPIEYTVSTVFDAMLAQMRLLHEG